MKALTRATSQDLVDVFQPVPDGIILASVACLGIVVMLLAAGAS